MGVTIINVQISNKFLKLSWYCPSLQTTMFRREAREVVRRAVNASEEDDVVIFAGSGCTGAIHKLIGALGIK